MRDSVRRPGGRGRVQNIVKWRTCRFSEVAELNVFLPQELHPLERSSGAFLSVEKRPAFVHCAERDLWMHFAKPRLMLSQPRDVDDPRAECVRLRG